MRGAGERAKGEKMKDEKGRRWIKRWIRTKIRRRPEEGKGREVEK